MSYMNWPVLFWFKCPGIISVEFGGEAGERKINFVTGKTLVNSCLPF